MLKYAGQVPAKSDKKNYSIFYIFNKILNIRCNVYHAYIKNFQFESTDNILRLRLKKNHRV